MCDAEAFFVLFVHSNGRNIYFQILNIDFLFSSVRENIFFFGVSGEAMAILIIKGVITEFMVFTDRENLYLCT